MSAGRTARRPLDSHLAAMTTRASAPPPFSFLGLRLAADNPSGLIAEHRVNVDIPYIYPW